MRFGINTCLWTVQPTQQDLPSLARRVAAAGADWIELPLYGDAIALDSDETAAVLRDHALGLSICTALGAHEDLASPAPGVRSNGELSLTRCIEHAGRMGATVVVGSFHFEDHDRPALNDGERERTLSLQAPALRRVSERAAQAGLTLAIEPLNRYETSQVNSVAQALTWARAVDHPAFGIMVDTFHAHIEETSLTDALRAAGPRLLHVHANESHRGIPGDGAIDWLTLSAVLRELRYEGALVIETFDAAVPEVARGGRMWRALAPSPDSLAAQGIGFLRRTMGGVTA